MRRKPTPILPPDPPQPDYGAIARRLELISAKAQTLAVELQHPPEDPSYPAQLAEYLRDLYVAMEAAVSDVPTVSRDTWSRA